MNTHINSSHQYNIKLSLFLMRITVFLVMLVWTVDKFTDPALAVSIFDGFYYIGGVEESTMLAIGAIEMVVILLFLVGIWKKYTYGAILLLHGVSTFSSWKQYLAMDLLFYAAWPMFAACVTLFLLRDLDTNCTIRLKTSDR